jgi:hypothetical protein
MGKGKGPCRRPTSTQIWWGSEFPSDGVGWYLKNLQILTRRGANSCAMDLTPSEVRVTKISLALTASLSPTYFPLLQRSSVME